MYNRVILIGHVALEPTRDVDSADLHFFQVDADNERVVIMANTFPDQVRPIHPDDVNLKTDDEVLVEGKLVVRPMRRGDDGHDDDRVTHVVVADRIARLDSPSIWFRIIGGRTARSIRVDGQHWGDAERRAEGWYFHAPKTKEAQRLAGRTFPSRAALSYAIRQEIEYRKYVRPSPRLNEGGNDGRARERGAGVCADGGEGRGISGAGASEPRDGHAGRHG